MDFDGVLVAGAESVRLLQLDHVDLYLIHAPFAFAEGVEAGLAQWRAMLALRDRGLAKHVGVSNYGLPHLQAIADAGLEMPVANQLELHPLHQQRELLAYMASNGVTPIAYSSLAPLTTWRVKDDGTRQRSAKSADDDARVAATLGSIARAHEAAGMTEATLLLRCALQWCGGGRRGASFARTSVCLSRCFWLTGGDPSFAYCGGRASGKRVPHPAQVDKRRPHRK